MKSQREKKKDTKRKKLDKSSRGTKSKANLSNRSKSIGNLSLRSKTKSAQNLSLRSKAKSGMNISIKGKKTKLSQEFMVNLPATLKPEESLFQTGKQKEVFEKFCQETIAAGVEGLLKEYNAEVKPYVYANVARKVFDENMEKNRYKDVVCNDHTRVVLPEDKAKSQGDYIHANYVRGMTPLYILTQGPLPKTVNDFWRMIVSEKVQTIVQLCNFVENGRKKLENYYPASLAAKEKYDEITITCTGLDAKDPDFLRITLKLEFGTDQTMEVYHIHYKTWPDKAAPADTNVVVKLCEMMRSSVGAVVIHCSAGIGRTGTLMATEMCIQTLLNGKPLKMMEVCKLLRNCRSSAVQVEVQYLTIAETVLSFAVKHKYVDDQKLFEDITTFKATAAKYIQEHPVPDFPPTPDQQ